MKGKKTKKTPKFMKLRHKIAVFKSKLKKSEEVGAFKQIVFEIIAYSFLGGMSILVFYPVHILIKFLSVGCFLWLFKEKLYDLVCGVLSSISLVKNYR